MTKEDIVSKVKTLHLPKNSYVVFGGCPLAALGIRESNDIDLFVSQETYEQLSAVGWKKVMKGPNNIALEHEVFEAHNNWNFGSYNPTLADVLTRAFEVDGVQFASLEDVKQWKAISGRPKDFADIQLIDQYIGSGNRP